MAETGPDQETIAFARRVFQAARDGEAEALAAVLRRGVPPNLRNEKGDSLLILAAYHGREDAVRVLLELFGGPPVPPLAVTVQLSPVKEVAGPLVPLRPVPAALVELPPPPAGMLIV
jgi:hypothetical protein